MPKSAFWRHVMNDTQTPVSMKELGAELASLQQKVTAAGLPVIILFEGFSATGKGAAISSLILNFDPRGYDVYPTRAPDSGDARKPWLARFARKAPAKGRISVFDRAWYSGIFQLDKHVVKTATWPPYLNDINMFERQLNDDGCLIIKFFFSISKKEQEKRLKKLLSHQDTVWRVTDNDLGNLKHYKRNERFYRKMIEATDRPYAKWHIVDAKKRRHVKRSVLSIVASEIERALQAKADAREVAPPSCPQPYINVKFNLLDTKSISDYDLGVSLAREEYKTQLKKLQGELRALHNVIYKEQMPVIIAYEGNDAAGKGGNIRRVAGALDPRGYTVTPISAPSKEELTHHYLWRFYNRLPKTGHISIFDRTWYGRVLVERVEGFTPSCRVEQAFNEINEFEYSLHEWGAVIIKFWLAIDKDEQLRRFTDRQNTPSKQWKITDEDWRNRDKWDDYAVAVDDMLKYTNTEFAPWTVVESNSKYFARIKTLKTIIKAVKDKLY